MLDKLKQAVEISMNALAPPPPLHEDFVYHWKRFMKHYLNLSFESKAAVELTNLPGCLDRMKDILVSEDKVLIQNSNNTEIGACMEYLLQHNLLDLLVSIAISDEPPGIKPCILRFFSKMLTQLNEPNIAHSSMYIPLMKLMNVCDGLLHSVCEAEEIEFLLHLTAVLRKQPSITVIFCSDESAKYLTEITETGDSIQYKNILDLVLTFVDSADSNIRVKACQCILLLCSVNDDVIAQHIVDNFKFSHFLIGRLTTLFYEIPAENYEQIKLIDASWTLDIPLDAYAESINNRQAIVFFCWLDFINQLSLECHPLIKDYLKQSITKKFVKEAFRATYLSSPETFVILYKYYCSITSPVLLAGFQEWLIGSESEADVPEVTTNPILQTLINNCLSENEFLAVTGLEFFGEVIMKCDERIINSLVLCYLKDRLYYDSTAMASSWSDEEDERQKYSSSPEALSCSRTLAPPSIDRIIQSFVNVIPSQVRTQQVQENILFLQSEYEQLMSRCSQFNWPTEALSDVESISNDSNPEVDSHNKSFYEGPFLRMLFTKIRNMPHLCYSQMLLFTTIISKLAMLPHPFLHEYLLNPSLPLRKKVTSLYSTLQHVMNDVSSRVQLVLNYQNELKAIRDEILNEKEFLRDGNEIDRYLLACVILEELCNELAAIAYVKYSYFH